MYIELPITQQNQVIGASKHIPTLVGCLKFFKERCCRGSEEVRII
jgi:hypothetical protein